jgi:hypothetical protein
MLANLTVEENSLPAMKNLRDLAGLDGTCVTLYLGGHRAGSGSRPMKVRLPAMLTEAERLLDERGVLPTDQESLLAPLRALAKDPDMGAGNGDGLAIFRTSRHLEQMTLPWEVADLVAVEGCPLLTPLVRGMESHREFLLLALSRKHTRLLECGPSGQHNLELPAVVPQGIEGDFDPSQRTLGKTSAGVQFGYDTFSEKQPQHFHDFCRALDRALQPLLEERGLPLVLMGTTAEQAAYRAVSKHPLLVPEGIDGSPDAGRTGPELAEKGRAALRSWQPAEMRHAIELYMKDGPGKKSAEMDEILREAAAGRVMHLFLTGDISQRGNVDLILGRVLPSGSPLGDRDNLANAAAMETWRHHGQVWSVDEAVDGTAIAAVFRW